MPKCTCRLRSMSEPKSPITEPRRKAADYLLNAAGPDHAVLESALRYLAKHRAELIRMTLLKHHGPTVQGGPFAGMIFADRSYQGSHLPMLLGCHEADRAAISERLKSADSGHSGNREGTA